MTESTTATLLIIDDEETICFAFKRYFERRNYRVLTAGTVADGLACCAADQPDVVLSDVRLPDGSGLDALPQYRSASPDSCIIVITAFGSLETAARATQADVFDYLVKPIDLDNAAALIEQYLDSRDPLPPPVGHAPPTPDAESTDIIGTSPAMQEVFKTIVRAAQTSRSVLITGETGTGKEMTARKVHELSDRKDQPFVAVNCGALPENLVESELFGYVKGAFTGAEQDKPGRVELANGGTLFLDEIGELPGEAQVKLLRFLDDQIVERLGSLTPIQLDVRVIAATNRDIAGGDGGFRSDLYYRLAVIEIGLPPLRQRRRDIDLIAARFASPRTVSATAAAVLRGYDWPGNVRELRNAIEHAITMATGDVILPMHLPPHIAKEQPDNTASEDGSASRYVESIPDISSAAYRAVLDPVERQLIRRALDECGGNQSLAAERLGIHRNTLRRRIRELEI
jgi:two-component system nitrogen regulation response regulator GlnG